MKTCILFAIALFPLANLYSQPVAPEKNDKIYTEEIAHKVLSGMIFEKMEEGIRTSVNSLKSATATRFTIALYFDAYPSAAQQQELQNLGCCLYAETWTPPLYNHPYGFMVSEVLLNNLPRLAELPFVKKIGNAGKSSRALNNIASQSVRANAVWDYGYTGKGKKIAVIDSGIDTTYAGSDFPSSFQKKDYSYYPLTDNNVANLITGHGTHVAATALGRGVLSAGHSHSTNGRGAFKGLAPGADLVFLKIGQDDDSFASDPAVIAAIDAAVNVYDADIISMSYGGWDDHHDGTGLLDQKVDWAYGKGTPFFCSAGNHGDANKHWMGTIGPNSESDFIELIVTDPKGDSTMLRFNMVWSDGTKRNDLSIKYYNSSKQILNDVRILPVTESAKGTESRYSFYEKPLTLAGTYFLKVINNSGYSQFVHVFEDWNNLKEGTDHVRFAQGDPSHTIGSPGTAEYAMAVGAYISKTDWTNSQNSNYWYGASSLITGIAPFSSRGPTIDGRIKPDICAPGSAVASLRDKSIYQTANWYWIDNNGIIGGDANYYILRGTSMACPVVSGSAALYLEKYPTATPPQVYQAMKQFSNQTGLTNLPDNTWGSGRLDILSAIQGSKDPVIVDGNLNDSKYATLAKYNSGRNGMGNEDNIGELKYYSDGENLYVGITGEVTGNNNIMLFMDFSGIQGRGTNTLGGGNAGEWVYCAFGYMGNVKMDFDVDFALAFNEGNSTRSEFFTDAIRYGTANKAINVGKTNQNGANASYEIGSVFGGKGLLTIAYDSSFTTSQGKGVEVKIPVSAFAGADTSQTIRFFAVISTMDGKVSNECLPGDPGTANLGDGADFSVIQGQDFFTQPVKISKKTVVGTSTQELPRNLSLQQNYPNPFSGSTLIGYHITAPDEVSLTIADHTGKEVAVLIHEKQQPGEHHFVWNASGFAPGIYFYRLKTNSGTETKKLVLLK